jgi:hypothetical protein
MGGCAFRSYPRGRLSLGPLSQTARTAERTLERHPAGFGSAIDWVSNLARFEIELLRDGTVVERGHADNVLDGPLSALRHLVGLLARDPINLPLAIGDIITTGTLTRAFPILPGENWSTTLHGIELGGRPVWFA